MASRQFSVRANLEAKDAASPTIDRVQRRSGRFLDFLRQRFVFTLSEVSRLAQAAFRQIDEAGRLDSQTEALRRNLAAQGVAFDAYLAKLREVSRDQVSNAQLIESSSQALLLGIPAEKIADLLEIARASAIATGSSVAQAFDDITTGIGRASPLILDNLGITLKLGAAYEAMASQVGKSADELTSSEQKQAILNEVLRVGAERVALFGDAQSDLSAALSEGTAAAEDFKTKLGQVVGVVGLLGATLVSQLAASVLFVTSGIAKAVGELGKLGSALPGVGGAFGAVGEAASRAGDRLQEASESAGALESRLLASLSASAKAALGLEQTSESAAKAATGLGQAADQADRLSGSASSATSAVEKLGDALGVVTSADLASQIATIETNLAKARTELGANSDEFVRLEEVAREKLESLRARLESVRRGLGDLEGQGAALTAENQKLASSFDDVGAGAAAAVDSLRATGSASASAATGQRSLQRELSTTRQRYDSAAAAAARFNAVSGVPARSRGQQGAVDAAVSAGLTPILGGTRIRLPGGGSRLLRDDASASL